MSFLGNNRILCRIIFPFTFLFAITSISSWLISAYLINHYLNTGLNRQMEDVTRIISNSNYVLNPNILMQLKEIIDGEIVLFDQDGNLIRSTIADSGILEGISAVAQSNPETGSDPIDTELGGKRYRALIREIQLPEYGRSFISLWMQTDEIDDLSQRIIFLMGAIVLFGIVAMAGAGFFIARTITAPVEGLVNSAIRIAEGDFNERAKADTRDEIGILAESFNRMIDRIKISEKNLVESEKLAAAGRMAAGFAHEIRNPLTSIKMMAQVLHGRLKGQQENREILESFIKEINRLDRIIQEIINRARPTELNKAPGQINKQVQEVLMIAQENLISQGIEIRLDLAEGLPEIDMDTEKIKQVLWNLILNARDAMPKGGQINIKTDISNNRFITVIVKDSGQGIHPDHLDRLFQPFFTTKPEGVGLGLTMSLSVVEQHGGRMTLKNRPEGGVEASFSLPIT